jgi:hypothetical protein
LIQQKHEEKEKVKSDGKGGLSSVNLRKIAHFMTNANKRKSPVAIKSQLARSSNHPKRSSNLAPRL